MRCVGTMRYKYDDFDDEYVEAGFLVVYKPDVSVKWTDYEKNGTPVDVTLLRTGDEYLFTGQFGVYRGLLSDLGQGRYKLLGTFTYRGDSGIFSVEFARERTLKKKSPIKRPEKVRTEKSF